MRTHTHNVNKFWNHGFHLLQFCQHTASKIENYTQHENGELAHLHAGGLYLTPVKNYTANIQKALATEPKLMKTSRNCVCDR
jgi:hypothetical protein